jgi:cellulose synthase/poly-beta-1,6-N-acetylglucosamine synthase-like glycosyltransferase
MKNLKLEIAEDALDDAFISQAIWKKGYKIGYEPLATVYVKNPSNFSDWLKQKRRNTSSDLILKKYFGNIQTSRSFKNEASKFYTVFTYANSFKEFCYALDLLSARLIVWWLGFWDTKIKKKQMKQIWVRVESTK